MNKIYFFSFIFLLNCVVTTGFGMDQQYEQAQKALNQIKKQWPLNDENKEHFAKIEAFFDSFRNIYIHAYEPDSSSSDENDHKECPPPSQSLSESDNDAEGLDTLEVLGYGRYF